MNIDFDKFIEACKRTECGYKRIYGHERLLHGVMGVVDEAGELNGALKKHIFYGKPLDRVNMAEEIGDLMYFVAILVDELGLDLETILKLVEDKLKQRYKDGFTEHEAINRDLQAEKEIMEGILNDY